MERRRTGSEDQMDVVPIARSISPKLSPAPYHRQLPGEDAPTIVVRNGFLDHDGEEMTPGEKAFTRWRSAPVLAGLAGEDEAETEEGGSSSSTDKEFGSASSACIPPSPFSGAREDPLAAGGTRQRAATTETLGAGAPTRGGYAAAPRPAPAPARPRAATSPGPSGMIMAASAMTSPPLGPAAPMPLQAVPVPVPMPTAAVPEDGWAFAMSGLDDDVLGAGKGADEDEASWMLPPACIQPQQAQQPQQPCPRPASPPVAVILAQPCVIIPTPPQQTSPQLRAAAVPWTPGSPPLLVQQPSPQLMQQTSPQLRPQQVPPQPSPQQLSPQLAAQKSPQQQPHQAPKMLLSLSSALAGQDGPAPGEHHQQQTFSSPQQSLRASPRHSAEPSPQQSRQASPQQSRRASPQASPQLSPQLAPMVSPHASPSLGPSAPQLNKITLTASAVPGMHQVLWTIDAGKLKGHERQSVSPSFQLPTNLDANFRLVLCPKLNPDSKGGASFKKASGWGSVQLKCEASSGIATFLLSVSDGRPDYRRQPRGPVTHNFAMQSTCGLPKEQEQWDFNKVVDEATQTFVVHLDITPLT
eukprot:TRINITY_DN27368_c0_g1_i2.p1 TRINITY_DN27368_c0_g1~~TRINITY_DN27368_c0_g1_i2.p1  ORF type:complete len:597 (+),score=119.28 TRINITY_DN27368_c0_g1_i2:46-1791(+)